MTVVDVLERLRVNWAVPRAATHRGEPTSFRLRCEVEAPIARSDRGVGVSSDLTEFWMLANSAKLFEDVDYGQWGLVLFGPDQAAIETSKFCDDRQNDCVPGDLIVGRFLGDQDLLLVRCDPDAFDFGRVKVVLPLDIRADWYDVAANFGSFLENYEREEGDKYWENV